MTLTDIMEMLVAYGQKHLLRFYDELSEVQKKSLLTQIEKIDFTVIPTKESILNSKPIIYDISPIKVLLSKEIEQKHDQFFNLGIDKIKKGKICAVLLAGGQGSRLGFEGPKGMLNIGINKPLCIFEKLILNMMEVVNAAQSWIPLYILVSEANAKQTMDFFRDNNYFGYNEKYIEFFEQGTLPSIDFEGKILLEKKDTICFSPDGNGNWFTSLKTSKHYQKIKEQGIEWINVFSVDNVLQRIADPVFIGATVLSCKPCGAKVVYKTQTDEKLGVICLSDNKARVIEYFEFPNELADCRTEDGFYKFGFGVTLNYLFSLDSLESISSAPMPIHISKKKISCIDDNGIPMILKEPNGFKLETLTVDMVQLIGDCLPYEVIREKEFAPIKERKGIDSIESAQELLIRSNYPL